MMYVDALSCEACDTSLVFRTGQTHSYLILFFGVALCISSVNTLPLVWVSVFFLWLLFLMRKFPHAFT